MPQAINALLDELEAEGRARLIEAGVARRARHGRAHRPTCAWSARCTRSRAACRRARSTAAASARSARPSPRPMRRATRRSTTAPRIEAINFRVRCVGPGAQALADRARPAAATPAAKRKGCAPRLVRGRLCRGRRSMTAMRSRPATASTGPAIIEEREATTVVPPGDSRLGRRQPQPAHRHRPGSAAAARWSRRTCRSRRRGAHRGRSDRARDHVEPAGQRRRGDVADRLPHRLLADHLGSAGFRLRAARSRRARPLAHSPRAMPVFNLTPAARREGAAGEVSRRDAEAGRRADHQRSVALRRPPVRHRDASRRCSATGGSSA